MTCDTVTPTSQVVLVRRIVTLTHELKVVPGHPVTNWSYRDPALRPPPPTPEEFGDIFTELDVLGDLSVDSWVQLRRFSEQANLETAVQCGELICRPDDDQFNAEQLIGIISDDRVEVLLEGRDVPTPDELECWRSIHWKAVELGEAYGHFTVFGWKLTDDQGRERLLATLHEDRALFYRVAGLYRSVEHAAEQLRGYGLFRWIW